ncbi:unnamed protein product, partial [marine sediment metagenome]
ANVVRDLAHRGRGFLFDIPDIEAQGWRLGPLGAPVPSRLWGFDVRARMVATDIFVKHLKATGRIADDFDLKKLATQDNPFDNDLREFLTQFGQFNTNFQTNLVRIVRERRLNPFAGSQGGFRPAELETLFGMHRLPKEGMSLKMRGWYSAQVLYGGWLGYMGMLMVGNKALSGHWPWQNQEGHEFDLDIGLRDTNGAPAYLSANLLEPAFSRAARTTGIKALFDERLGITPVQRAAGFFTSGKAANEALSFLAAGPPVQA